MPRVIQVAADGTMTELRKGTNGWTCMPDNPQPRARTRCAWTPTPEMGAGVDGVTSRRPRTMSGVMYMLQGGTDASNTDPYRDKPTDGKWVETGPHVMVVGRGVAERAHPASADPDTTKPYVMFGGTPYAHMMIPIK